jgi:predicted PurR-regulated permease PerM
MVNSYRYIRLYKIIPMNNNDSNNDSNHSYINKVWITVSIVAFTTVMLLILNATFNVLLLVFAGILIAVFLRGLSGLLQRKTNWNETGCLVLTIFGVLVLMVGFFWLVGAKIQMQVSELTETLPKTIEKARAELSKSPIGEQILERISSEESAMKIQKSAASFFKSTFGVFGDLYVLFFIGIFLTVSPKIYINGIVELVPISGQDKAKHIFKLLGQQLRNWIKGKLLSMFVVFFLTAVSLAILGIPLWLVLALLAGLLSFIPNFGPILALFPAVLVGLMQGPQTALWIIGLYVLIQFIESNFITTLIQQKMVNIPPALTISAQMILGALTGSWGLLLSTPLLVVLIVLIKQLYIQRRSKTNGRTG